MWNMEKYVCCCYLFFTLLLPPPWTTGLLHEGKNVTIENPLYVLSVSLKDMARCRQERRENWGKQTIYTVVCWMSTDKISLTKVHPFLISSLTIGSDIYNIRWILSIRLTCCEFFRGNCVRSTHKTLYLHTCLIQRPNAKDTIQFNEFPGMSKDVVKGASDDHPGKRIIAEVLVNLYTHRLFLFKFSF